MVGWFCKNFAKALKRWFTPPEYIIISDRDKGFFKLLLNQSS